MGLIVVECGDKCRLGLEEVVALEIDLLKEQIKNNNDENPVYRLPCITSKTLNKVNNYLKNLVETSTSNVDFDAEFVKQVDLFTLFHLIQAAHHLKIKSLIDLTCLTLVNMVMTKTPGDITREENLHGKHFRRDERLRSHEKEAFIMQSDFVDVQLSPFVTRKLHFINRRVLEFNSYVKELESSDLLKPDESMRDCDRDKLDDVIMYLEMMIDEDRRLAECLTSNVTSLLVHILEINPQLILQKRIGFILSRTRYELCSDIIEQKAIPMFVDLMASKLEREAVITLTRLAYASSEYVKVIIRKGALEAAQKIFKNDPDHEVINNLAKFLVAVCRGGNLTPDKVNVALTISADLFQQRSNSYRHIAWTCNALSYLSFEKAVPFEWQDCRRIISFISHKDKSVAGSALGVIGNIARWGTFDQIQYLANDYELLECLEKKWLRCKFKKFRKEACQIISNMAARRFIFIKIMDQFRLIDPLCTALKEDESDVKMEAAWAIFNALSSHRYVHNDDYNKDT